MPGPAYPPEPGPGVQGHDSVCPAMSIEVQAWPYISTQTAFTVKLVRYRIIHRSTASSPQISILVSYEFLPPAGLVNSEGLNLFIGNNL